jgi:hypothetical protein
VILKVIQIGTVPRSPDEVKCAAIAARRKKVIAANEQRQHKKNQPLLHENHGKKKFRLHWVAGELCRSGASYYFPRRRAASVVY